MASAGLLLGAASLRAGYKIETVAYPTDLIRGGISAVTFTPQGSLVIATRLGEVWMRSANGQWKRFARGLDEPLGIVAESERVVFIAHRPEVLRATDRDGNGEAETFDALGGEWGMTVNYHEFFFGLKRDRAGNFYGAASLESTAGNANVRNEDVTPTRGARVPSTVSHVGAHRSDVPWRGWAIRIGPDGKSERFASGFRQPNGIGLSPDDEVFFNDNQGDYKPSCGLLHVERGDFHGHVASLKWEPGSEGKPITTEEAWRRYKSPAVVFPHGPMGISGGEPVWDTTGGKFGPFAGQVFAGDFSPLVVRASLEKIAGAWQGACFPFLGRNEAASYVTGAKLAGGGTRGAFGPDGAYYLAATGGWGAGADALQRIVWDGRATADLRNVTLTDRGFVVSFTAPMDPATLARTDAYQFNRFRFYYQAKYGSPWVDEAKVEVKEVHPAADGLSAEVVLAELRPGFVYEISVPALRSRDGEPLANPLAFYTANRLRNGEKTVGGTARLPRPDETTTLAKDPVAANATGANLVAAGEKIYRLYCVACHQPDGRGVAGGAANFRDDKTRLAKSDAELLAIIDHGNEAKAMPAFGSILAAGQRRAVLAYVREMFGETK